ncbi:c-type cytochrome [Phaeobacter porticola]|uniref:Cytochrome c556 n=1 Tax=Phaeobacter porticola TaxID=1844006 RepID=A0A1L3I0E9_9RHOB|nr:cytochrome c [Phaeobacter porticola]APG45581.1 Cytochrome c556 [Phaeobacter porticola]
MQDKMPGLRRAAATGPAAKSYVARARTHPDWRKSPPVRLMLLAAMMIIVVLLLNTAAKADNTPTNKYVAERIALMSAQKNALQDLIAMTRDYIVFDRSGAREARRALIRSTGRIPKHFRRDVTDLSSHARGGIWTNWDDFTIHAKDTQNAARALNTRSAAGLKRSLPRLISSCHNCHQIYRITPREFTTH